MSSPKVTFLILVNSKSGGQDGLQLLEKFLQIFQEVKYENISFQINVKWQQGFSGNLIWQFQEKLRGEVVSLTEPAEGGGVVGPGPGLRKYRDVRNLRVVGEYNEWHKTGTMTQSQDRLPLNREPLSRDIVNYTNTRTASLPYCLTDGKILSVVCSNKIVLHLIPLSRCKDVVTYWML